MTTAPLTFVRVTDQEGLKKAWAIRHEVFVVEQAVPVELEMDEADHAETTRHLLALRDAVVIGTGRVLGDGEPGTVHIGRVAIVQQERGKGVGAALMKALERVALEDFGVGSPRRVRVELSAQESAMEFYHRIGYQVISGERYLDAGIWHQDMTNTIEA